MGSRRIATTMAAFGTALGAAILSFAAPAVADDAPTPTPGMQVDDDAGRCTAGFAATDAADNYYLLTSGHCDAHDDALWTYADGHPLGHISVSERDGDLRDAAVIRLDPEVGTPNGHPNGKYRVRDVLSASDLKVGMPFCKTGAVTGETCGEIKGVEGDVVETSVHSLAGDSGSPGFVMNPDGTVSAVGLLMSSPEDDDDTTYFALVHPLLDKWGLTILE